MKSYVLKPLTALLLVAGMLHAEDVALSPSDVSVYDADLLLDLNLKRATTPTTQVTLLATPALLTSWQGGYAATLTIKNTSQTAITSWTASLSLPANQTIKCLWNATYTASGQNITINSTSANSALNAGQSVIVGFSVNDPQNTGSTLTSVSASGTAPVTPPPAQSNFTTKLTITNDWGSGYQAELQITNTGSTAATGWTVEFDLPAGQAVGSLWNADYTASGSHVVVKNPAWAATLAGGASTSFGFVINGSGAHQLNNINAYSGSSPAPTPIPVPSVPTLNPISITAGSNNYTVSWNAVTNATSYTLQQDTTSAFSNPTVVSQGSATNKAFSNIANGTYYYRVSATNATGTSAYSAAQSVIVNVTPVPPVQLTTPVLQAISNPTGANTYQLSWNSVANAQSYKLEESGANTFTNPVTVFSGSATSYQVTGKTAGTYYYRVTAVAGTSTSTPSTAQSTTVVSQPTPPPSTLGTIVEGYWESWSQSTPPLAAIVAMNANIIDVSFANFSSTGNHTYQVAGLDCDQATLTQLITLTHNAGKKIKISIGGATFPIAPQLQTTQDAVGMAQAITTFVQQNNLDGVDVDIEDNSDSDLQVALLQNLRQLLGSNAIISYTPRAPASTTAPHANVIKNGHQYLNYISIMAYNAYTGYSYQQDAQQLIAMGVPASKIVIGLMPGLDDMGVNTSVANIQTAANYVKQNNLGGVMFWDLNRDYLNITGIGASAATNTAWSILH